jgi:outer membrane protein assembly factor BamB
MIRVSFLVCLTVAGAWAGSDWPQFRGPAGDGHSDAKDVPLVWGERKNVAWVTPIPGRGWSSPVVKDGKIYLTTALVTDGSAESNPKADRSLRALCLDASSGRILWNVEVFNQVGATAPATIHQKNGHASPTPIITSDRLYVHFGHQGAASLDLTGKKVWEDRSFSYPPRHGNGGSPVLVDGRLIFNCDAEVDPFIIALESRSGRMAWRISRPPTEQKQTFAFATCGLIEVDGRKQLISPGAGAVDSFDPATGQHLWRVRYEGYSNVPKPVAAHGLLYISSSYDTPDVYCIDPRGASGDVTETHVKWISGKGAPMTVSPLVVGDEIYWVTDQGGMVTCSDAHTGEVHWRERVGGRAHSASPLYAGGRIYLQDEDGRCVVLKPGTAFEILAANQLPERSLATPAATDGALIIRTESKLWRIGAR